MTTVSFRGGSTLSSYRVPAGATVTAVTVDGAPAAFTQTTAGRVDVSSPVISNDAQVTVTYEGVAVYTQSGQSSLVARAAASSAAAAALSASSAANARDAALIQAGVYVDEPTGRAAVADGAAFKVQGTGAVAAYEYRRVSSSASALIATYPSASSIYAEVADRKSVVDAGASKVGNRSMAAVEVDDAGRVTSGVALDGTRVLWAGEEFARANITLEQDEAGVRFKSGGALLLGLKPGGDVETANEIQTGGSTTASYAWAPWADESGRVPLWFDSKGRAGLVPVPGVLDSYIAAYLAANPQTTSTQNTQAQTGRHVLQADINHIMVSGQSLSIGYGSTPGLTTTQPFDNLMPSVGVLDGSVDDQGLTGPPTSTGFSPLAFLSQQAGLGETVGLGGANFTRKLLNDVSPGNTVQMLVSNNGRGATAIGALSKGGLGNFEWGIQQCAAYRSLALALGRTYRLRAVWWIQGETDSTNNTARAVYKSALKKYVEDLNSDLAQSNKAPLLTYQMASHTKRGTGRPPEVALAQLEAAREHSDIYLVTPTYHLNYNGDGIHLTAHSTRWLSQYFAKVDHQVCSLGVEWRPLEPVAARQQGHIVDIDFHVPVGPLVLDTELVSDPGNYGFEVLDGETNEILPITNVALRGSSGVRILLAYAPSSQVRVRYAYGADGWVTGPNTGARGNLRDSDKTVAMYTDASGKPYKLHNWCVIFNEICEVL